MRRLAVLLVLTACAPSEDPPGGPSTGAPTMVAPNGRATVALTSAGVGLAGADVVFHDSDGEVLAHVRSDARGEASGEITPHGMVTVLHPEYTSDWREIITVREVDGGDRIAIDVPPQEA